MLVIACVLTRWLRSAIGLVAVGVVLLGLALTLALTPIRSFPASAPGASDCRALLFGSGPYGDSDEACFDLRTARRFDTYLTGLTGLFIGSVGMAMLITGDPVLRTRRRQAGPFPGTSRASAGS